MLCTFIFLFLCIFLVSFTLSKYTFIQNLGIKIRFSTRSGKLREFVEIRLINEGRKFFQPMKWLIILPAIFINKFNKIILRPDNLWLLGPNTTVILRLCFHSEHSRTTTNVMFGSFSWSGHLIFFFESLLESLDIILLLFLKKTGKSRYLKW